jgi:peroxiredoxin
MKMKKYLILALSVSLVAVSCSKKESSDNENIKKQDNTSQNTQQTNKNNNVSTNNPGNTSPASSFGVKNIGNVDRKEMIDFTWNENGKDVKLSDYKGKVIVLNFWATWCGPCRKELPSLSQLSNDLKDKNFKLIGISVDDNQAIVDNFLKTNSLSYTILQEPNQLVAKYMSAAGQNENVIPQTYIIDRNGKVVESLIGSRSKEDFLSIINKYL